MTRYLHALSVCLAAALGGPMGPTSASAACAGMTGDLNGDGAVTVADAQCGVLVVLAVLQGQAGLQACLIDVCAADANCDGSVTIGDVMQVVQLALDVLLPDRFASPAGCPSACAVDAAGDACPGCAWLHEVGCEHWVYDGAGCGPMPAPDGTPCGEELLCGGAAVCQQGQCVAQGAADCDTCNPCHEVVCPLGAGCQSVPKADGTPCGDPDPCLPTQSCHSGWCVPGPPNLNCIFPPDPICLLNGQQGAVVECTLSLAAWMGGQAATALQWSVSFEAPELKLLAITATHCFPGSGCVELPAAGPGSQPLPSGAQLGIAPGGIADWNGVACSPVAPCPGATPCLGGICDGKGGGDLIAVNLTDPTMPFTDASLQGFGWPACIAPLNGAPIIVGDAALLTFRFQLLTDASESAAAVVSVANPSATHGPTGVSIAPMVFALDDGGLFVTGMGP